MEEIRCALDSDFATILALNDAEVQQTSSLSPERLRSLVRMAAYCKVAAIDGQVVAFLIALRDGSPYESDNYHWFVARFSHFLYIDRVVVAPRFARRGIGSRLYADLFAFARDEGMATVACEYNIDPPNAASRAFHDSFGFKEQGRQWVAGGSKQVSLQALAL